MQWSQIKTLFILCFLVLNIYLLYQFLEKQNAADLRVKEKPESSLESRLRSDNIKIGDLPDEDVRESFISVKQRHFNADDKAKLNALPNQQSVVLEDTLIVSKFTKPVAVPKGAGQEEITNMLSNEVLDMNDYEYWNWNKKHNVIIFFQKKNDQPVYFNQYGMIVIFLNDKNEMKFYTQMMLAEPESQNAEKKKVIKPIKAIETLYNANELNPGDEITKANLGFYTRMPFTYGVQVFVPTWKITVNDERHYFVNALEGFTFSSNDKEFLGNVMEMTVEKLKVLKGNEALQKDIQQELYQRIMTVNQEETE